VTIERVADVGKRRRNCLDAYAERERGGERVRMCAQVSGAMWASRARGSKGARTCGGGRRSCGHGRVHGGGTWEGGWGLADRWGLRDREKECTRAGEMVLTGLTHRAAKER
jgi:hypothetical protein